MVGESPSPGIQRVCRNTKRDMPRTSTVVLWQSAWRQKIAERCFVLRSRTLATDQKKISLLGNAKDAAGVASFNFLQTQNVLVKDRRPSEVLHEERGLYQAVQRWLAFGLVVSFFHSE